MAGLTKKTSAFDDENLSGRSQKLFFAALFFESGGPLDFGTCLRKEPGEWRSTG